MSKCRVVFFGSIGIAKKILDEIVLSRDVELLGVCCKQINNSWRSEETVFEYCVKHEIPILTDEDIILQKPDLGISVRYDRIIKKEVIDSFSLGIVNTHGGILPEYRGSYCNINAIINGEYEYGVTLHYIDEGVDTGDIIEIKKIMINDCDTGFDLYKISEQFCYELILDNIDNLLTGNNQRIPQSEYIAKGHVCNEYKAKETLELKCIDISKDEKERIWRIVRAFDSDNHEPAYMMCNNKKVYLRVRF